MRFLDQRPFNAADPDARELLAALLALYDQGPAVRQLVRTVGLNPAHFLLFTAPMAQVWPDILQKAADQELLPTLIIAVASNPDSAAYEVIARLATQLASPTVVQPDGAPHPDLAWKPVVHNRALLGRPGSIAIYDGSKLSAVWLKAVEASPLLGLCTNEDRVRHVVAECASWCGTAQDALRERTDLADPWTDPEYPGRVLRNAEFLLGYGGALRAEVPGPPEPRPEWLRGVAAMLIAAPFLREAVLAEGTHDAAGIEPDPADLSRTYRPGPRGDLELTHEMHQRLVRRADDLRQAGLAETANWLALWLVNQWLNGRTRLWEEPGAREVYQIGQPLIEGFGGTGGAGEVPRLVKTLLLAVGAEPADERLLEKLRSPYVGEDWRSVAAVLWLAGIMAADLRKLPPLVADLVGTGMELPLADVQAAAGLLPGRRADRQADLIPPAWEWDKGTLILQRACAHPAMYDAFEDIVHRADKAAQTIQEQLLPLKAEIAERLPRGFSAAKLRPETVEGSTDEEEKRAYEVPLSRFQIAEEKVRELLMGRQLYGDPSLAIRELYQNALDACRWRATRQEYLRRTRKDPPFWEGRIQFREGADGDGRRYIECEDSGVGMDINTLKHVFANAGERFVYGQDFRADQAAWAGLIPPLRMVSNSQFGVGVFSYFMLADEITVTTRYQRRSGVPEKDAHEVRIVSSGSFFQVRRASGLAGGGTRVRLYLTADSLHISALDTLRRLLAIAEHKVTVTAPDDDQETWEPGVLRYTSDGEKPRKHGDDLWWVSGDGGLAADGIWTGVKSFGLVANLRGEHRPQFTIDRKTLRAWDEDWILKQVDDDACGDLMKWPGFTLDWLWEMATQDTMLAQRIFDYAVKFDKSAPVHVYSPIFPYPPYQYQVRLSEAGCMPLDRRFLLMLTSRSMDITGDEEDLVRWIKTWRETVWLNLVTASQHSGVGGEPATLAGFPKPDPLDGYLFTEIFEKILERRSRFSLFSTPEHQTRAVEEHQPRAIRKKHPVSWDTARALRRLRKYAITGLDVSAARSGPPDSISQLSSAMGVADWFFHDLDRGKGYEWREWLGWNKNWVLAGDLLLTESPVRLTRLQKARTDAADRPPTLPDLAAAAFRLQTTLGEAAAAIQETAPGIKLPSLPAECAGIAVSQEIFEILLNLPRENSYQPVGDEYGLSLEFSWRQLGPRLIVRGAAKAGKPLGDYLGMLDPFRRLGAPVPAFDQEIRDALNQPGLDTNDGIMLDWRDNSDLPAVTALRLVQIAGRFGWTLAQAHRRLARLTPLGLSLEYPDAEIPDEIVRWQDLPLLTRFFDGQPPVISGRIDQAYLKKAAEEIYDAEPGKIAQRAAELRDRLQLYAALFQLEMPVEGDGVERRDDRSSPR